MQSVFKNALAKKSLFQTRALIATQQAFFGKEITFGTDARA